MANFPAILTNPTVLLGLRGAQFIMAIILLGLSGRLVDLFDGYFDEADYALFDGVWMLLAVPYLGYAAFNARGDHAMPAVFHPIAVLVIEILSHIFIFAAWIAIAAIAGEASCSHYYNSSYGVCGILTAYAVLGALSWLFLWIPTTFIVVLSSLRGGHFKSGAARGTTTTTTAEPLSETSPATTTTAAAPAAATTETTHNPVTKTEADTVPATTTTPAEPLAGTHEVDGTSSPNGATGTNTTTSTGNYPGV